MANPISKVNLVINGVTTQLDIHDANASEFALVSDLSTVATSGSYNDLSNKPTIPTVNNGTLTIQQNGTTVDTFTANSSSDKTVNISVPTKTSDLNNDSGFLTSEIDSMGTGWVRFKCGLQICYGMVTNDNNIATGMARFSFPKAFNENPNLTATPSISARYVVTVAVEDTTTWVLNTLRAYGGSVDYVADPVPVNYVAIGKWN